MNLECNSDTTDSSLSWEWIIPIPIPMRLAWAYGGPRK